MPLAFRFGPFRRGDQTPPRAPEPAFTVPHPSFAATLRHMESVGEERLREARAAAAAITRRTDSLWCDAMRRTP